MATAGIRPNIYADHAATTPVDPLVLAAMQPYLTDDFGNPSSLYRRGKAARKALEAARQTLADCLNTPAETLTLTGSGTESDNLAILGVARTLANTSGRRHLIVSAIEHAAVLNAARHLEAEGWTLTLLPVNTDGVVSLSDLDAALRPDTALVSVMAGNNEVGSLQPVEAIGALLRERGVLFHTDAVQVFGKLPLDLATLAVDYLSASAHKIYGPKGIGLLYCRPGAPAPTPLVFGGGQEQGLRSGTENVAAAVGFAEAARLAHTAMAEETPRLRRLQQQLMVAIEAQVPGAVINGPHEVALRVPGNVHCSFPPGEGEALVLHLDLAGIAASSGSACHSAVIEPSRVLLAMGKSEAEARATVRFSLGKSNTEADIPVIAAACAKVVTPTGSR
ncbi:MAG: cysteine desulfurase family protein [Candidatus Melainabacteria bacterium]